MIYLIPFFVLKEICVCIYMIATSFEKIITVKKKHISISYSGKESHSNYLIIDTDNNHYNLGNSNWSDNPLKPEMYYNIKEEIKYHIEGYAFIRLFYQ